MKYYHIPSTAEGLDFFQKNSNFTIQMYDVNPRQLYLKQYDAKIGNKTLLRYLDILIKNPSTPCNWHDLIKNITDTTYRLNNRFFEKILEEVRKDKFNTLPSRQSCLYIADEESLEFWYNKSISERELKQTEIFEIEFIDVKTHYADSNWLEIDIVKEIEYYETANSYWNGEKKETSSTFEILAIGKFKINGSFPDISKI